MRALFIVALLCPLLAAAYVVPPGKCLDLSDPVMCLVSPCGVSNRACKLKQCVDDYCGGCEARCHCEKDDDCFAGQYCRRQLTPTPAYVCTPYAQEGQKCGGRQMGSYPDQCSADMACTQMHHMRKDAPGVCLRKCATTADCKGDDMYCSTDGLCLSNAMCLKDQDCSAADNQWLHVACVGTASCQQGQCAFTCDSSSPAEADTTPATTPTDSLTEPNALCMGSCGPNGECGHSGVCECDYEKNRCVAYGTAALPSTDSNGNDALPWWVVVDHPNKDETVRQIVLFAMDALQAKGQTEGVVYSSGSVVLAAKTRGAVAPMYKVSVEVHTVPQAADSAPLVFQFTVKLADAGMQLVEMKQQASRLLCTVEDRDPCLNTLVIKRWRFDGVAHQCQEFTTCRVTGGNNFATREQCAQLCQ